MQDIIIKGAKEHNLKNIDVVIQRNKFVVVTGLSGSGKSSLVMDTLFAEGQRRFVESLSSYARQFLGLMEKPDVEEIIGLSPVIAIDQKSGTKNPRSTVGTVTEIYDYFRLLFARIGQAHCPNCHVPIAKQSLTNIANQILEKYNDQTIVLMANILRGVKGHHREILANLIQAGFLRARIDGEIVRLEEISELSRYQAHTIDVVIDRIPIKEGARSRLTESLETASKAGKGTITIQSENQDEIFSEKFACIECGYSFKEISPRLFSFNSPYGACSKCSGLGTIPKQSRMLPRLLFRYQRTQSQAIKDKIEETLSEMKCTECNGSRLNSEALSVTIGGKSIGETCALSIEDLKDFLEKLKISKQNLLIAEKVLKEIHSRIQFLIDVGLNYLTLSRSAKTLSGGESQRIRLATQIGSKLVNVLYILDEPSIGLHQKDNEKLLVTLENLRDAGNTLVVIEHDEETMRRADQIIDIGPKAGIHGGEVIFNGTYEEILKCPNSLTGRYLRGENFIAVPPIRRNGNGHKLVIKKPSLNNLKKMDVHFPLGKFISITGVSGSGKSSLINELLYKGIQAHFNKDKKATFECEGFDGLEHIDKIIMIDQSPIGRTPRSNPATYTGIFDFIRDLFSKLPSAQIKGYGTGRFSFNVKGGRCEACQGSGKLKIEMHFMPDVYVNCEECKGERCNPETLKIQLKGKNIADILQMTLEEASLFFENYPQIKTKIDTLLNVGLGYIRLGQSAITLSGGEAQRTKLARELSKRGTGKTLYILDEPTTGLHFADVEKLLLVLNRLVDKGNTVITIEHNLDVIKVSDHVIDLGPDGGDKGGEIITFGTPEEVLKHPTSYTAEFLAKVLPN
jgi:excinuclease ABC subunit A